MKGFIPKKVTFSEECLEMIREFQKIGSFRSLSSTIEEIVRRVHYIKETPTLNCVNVHFERLDIKVSEHV